jgi:acyl-homoserine-lactone acylase
VSFTRPDPATSQQRAVGGDTYIQAVESGAAGINARTLLTYGNWSRPTAEHVAGQLPLYVRGELRPALRNRAEVDAHAKRIEKY